MDHSYQCVIAGGGPAGLMLGVLLARGGVSVCVLEKHADFLRDFRGDTIHPSTLEVMRELGWLDELLKLPHNRVEKLSGHFGDLNVQIADFSHLPVAAKFIAMMPQWDFLNFLSEKGCALPGFTLMMSTAATGLVRDGARIAGVTARGPDGPLTITADLVVAADGRGSALRDAAGLVPRAFGAPMDVLWFRLPRYAADTTETQGRIQAGSMFIMLNRGDYWQCAYVIPKGANDHLRAAGIDAFRLAVGKCLPFDAERANHITSFDDVKLLTVVVDRLDDWALPGFLCIGDAAHAMSPAGGVGVNLAIQDAVAAANLLWRPLKDGTLTLDDQKQVQARRDFPTRMTQRLQLGMQNQLIKPVLTARGQFKPPLLVRLLAHLPVLSRIPARVIGMGVRPEHVDVALR